MNTIQISKPAFNRVTFQRKSRAVPLQQSLVTTSVLSSKSSTDPRSTVSRTESYWYIAPTNAQKLGIFDNEKLRDASHGLYDQFNYSSSESVGQVQDATSKPFNCHHLTNPTERKECVLKYALGDIADTNQEELGCQTSTKTFNCHHLSGSERSECVLQYTQDTSGRAVAQQSSPAVKKLSEVTPKGSAATAFNCHHLADSARSECVVNYAVEETAHTTQEELRRQTSKSFNCHNLSGSSRVECVLNF